MKKVSWWILAGIILQIFLVFPAAAIAASSENLPVDLNVPDYEITAPLHIDGEPVGMQISLDGIPSGVVDENGVLDIPQVSVGEHVVTGAFQGYDTQEIPVMVGQGLPTEVRITLDPIRVGTLTITSVPNNVQVYLDDLYKGITPLTMSDVSVGEHIVLLRIPGYDEYRQQVTITPETPVYVEGTLRATDSATPAPTQQSGSISLVFISLLGAVLFFAAMRR